MTSLDTLFLLALVALVSLAAGVGHYRWKCRKSQQVDGWRPAARLVAARLEKL